MALEGKGKVYNHAKGLVIIYVPAAIARDAKFPFRPGDEVNVKIGNRELIIGPRKRVAK